MQLGEEDAPAQKDYHYYYLSLQVYILIRLQQLRDPQRKFTAAYQRSAASFKLD